MNKALEAFLKELYTDITSGNLVDISNDVETITLPDIHRNDKYLNTTLTILSEYIIGWHAKIGD